MTELSFPLAVSPLKHTWIVYSWATYSVFRSISKIYPLNHKVIKLGHFYQNFTLISIVVFAALCLTRHLLTRLLRPQDPMFVFDFVFVLSLPSDSPESPKPPNFTGIISLRIITPVCRHQKSLLAASRVWRIWTFWCFLTSPHIVSPPWLNLPF